MAKSSIAVVGPTACGKTRRAVELARAFDGEIISADSRQVYRGMSIGTGKDIDEYQEVKYHLIDILPAGEKYNLHRFLHDFWVAHADIVSRGKTPVICGGSGMYVENALSGIELPEVPQNRELRAKLKDRSLDELTNILSQLKTLHNSTDVDTAQRAIRAIEIELFYLDNPDAALKASHKNSKPLNAVIIGLDIPRDLRRSRISARLKSRLDEGMVDEVRTLLHQGISQEDLIYYGLEYKFVTMYVIGKLTYEEMVSKLEIAIHQFAKRQMTWFRGMERRGFQINWLPFDLPHSEFLERVEKLMF